MSQENLTYTIEDKCSYCEVLAFMESVEKDFVPSLFQRVDVDSFISKILTRATINTCRYDGQIIGMIALYENNIMTKEAYITYLAVAAQWRKNGVASRLLQLADESSTKAGMKSISVSTCFLPVAHFYQQHAYSVCKTEYDAKADTERIYLKKS